MSRSAEHKFDSTTWYGSRTFGDLLKRPGYSLVDRGIHRWCAFCNKFLEVGWRYSKRRWICIECIRKREDAVLPIVRLGERRRKRRYS